MLLEQRAERRGIGRGVFDELEAVGAHRIDVVDLDDVGTFDAGHARPPGLTQGELVSYVTIMAELAQALELENFLPYRLSILAQIVSRIAARPLRRPVWPHRHPVAGHGGPGPLRAAHRLRCGAAHRHGQGGGQPGGRRPDETRPGRAGDRPQRPPPRLAGLSARGRAMHARIVPLALDYEARLYKALSGEESAASMHCPIGCLPTPGSSERRVEPALWRNRHAITPRAFRTGRHDWPRRPPASPAQKPCWCSTGRI